MCGLVGQLNFKGDVVNQDGLNTAIDLLESRGPDDRGVWIGDGIGLGHRRLSILDLSDAGHQPMQSLDGRFTIVFNGEVYNFQTIRDQMSDSGWSWKSHSDTEVVLAAYAKWGVACLERLRGMFAFAIWDGVKRELFAARDRMGVKPFYYSSNAERFLFASRPKALFVMDGSLATTIDTQALRYYLECGYVPAPYAIHQDIRKLPPAHYLLLDATGIRIKRYWDFQHIEVDESLAGRDEADLLDELDELLNRSVRSRMISDAPLGAFLSGGIDSSLMVALMQRQSASPIDTFTIGFNEKGYDESHHAQQVADYLGTNHHCEQLHVDDLLDLLPHFSLAFDEPFFDSSAFPVMAVSRLARQHVAVSLSGDGADELFGGYHYYQIAKMMEPMYRLPRFLRVMGARGLGLLPTHRAKLLSSALQQPDVGSLFAFSRSIMKDYPSLLSEEVQESTAGVFGLFSQQLLMFPVNMSGAEQGMRLDANFTLPDDYLQKVDVGSMAFSLESREPFLDHDLVAWAMHLPIQWKLRRGVNKYLLRKLTYRYLPRPLVDRPKQGFAVPIDAWLRDPLNSWANDRIHEKRLFDDLPVNQQQVIALMKLHESGARDVHPLLWAVLMLLDYLVQWREPNARLVVS